MRSALLTFLFAEILGTVALKFEMPAFAAFLSHPSIDLARELGAVSVTVLAASVFLVIFWNELRNTFE